MVLTRSKSSAERIRAPRVAEVSCRIGTVRLGYGVDMSSGGCTVTVQMLDLTLSGPTGGVQQSYPSEFEFESVSEPEAVFESESESVSESDSVFESTSESESESESVSESESLALSMP